MKLSLNNLKRAALLLASCIGGTIVGASLNALWEWKVIVIQPETILYFIPSMLVSFLVIVLIVTYIYPTQDFLEDELG